MIKFAAAIAAIAFATSVGAITVDGDYDAAYGAATATVAYDPTAPDSNFGAPTNASKYLAYSIYLNASGGNVYGYLRADPTPGGASAGTFANLYFDLDPANNNGSDIGFELGAGGANEFVAGVGGTVALGDVMTAVSADQLGFEFVIPNHYFTGPTAGLDFSGITFTTPGGDITLRLSQSFGYSVAGGASYGPDRLGGLTLSTVPEPASWGLMIVGFAMTGSAARRRRNEALI